MKGIDRYNNRSPQTTSSRIGTNNRILTDTRPRVLQANRHVQQQNTSRYEVQTPHVNLHAFQNNSETKLFLQRKIRFYFKIIVRHWMPIWLMKICFDFKIITGFQMLTLPE